MQSLTEMMPSVNLSEFMDTVKSNYLYIVGTLVVLLVAVAYFYYLKMNKPVDNSLNNNEDSNMECDGDKCFIKQSQPIYEKCDDEYAEHNDNKSVF